MTRNGLITLSLAVCVSASVASMDAADSVSTFVYENPHEFIAGGDFTGDGRADVVIADKQTGKYRLGYVLSDGRLAWVENRAGGMQGVTGFAVGRLLSPDRDAIVYTSPDANQVMAVDVSDPKTPMRPVDIPFLGLGPASLVSVKIGGPGNTDLDDLYIASIYNSPDPNVATLVRNDGSEFPSIAELPLPGTVTRANGVSTEHGPRLVALLLDRGESNQLRIEDVSSGTPRVVATADGLGSGSDFVTGRFGNPGVTDFLVYQPGGSAVQHRTLEMRQDGETRWSAGREYDLGRTIRDLVTVTGPEGPQLLVIFGEGEEAGVFRFDGQSAPNLAQTLKPGTNEVFTGAVALSDGFVALGHYPHNTYSTRYFRYRDEGSGFEAVAFGGLETLADNDNLTIPDIHARILSNRTLTTESEMTAYTNTIPGSPVTYAMVPIPGGEFVMGSPESEDGRQSDEGPQRNVRISPFWMQQFEITWNQYELFMYPEEEQRLRGVVSEDEAGDRLADAISRPSRPYVEMSFGMGKDGFPAVAMTQHAANKFCQWLSAKTGHFYRLPTEAEWEYAARAGTTTAYFFGDDPSKLPDYAWFEENSDFKYQRVGRKKPNPWGLYDIYGNVTEWVLDQYDPEFYAQGADGTVTDPWNRPTTPYPLGVRGGSWDDEGWRCRSAARRGSDPIWKMQDPQLPKSIWYFSDGPFVGFRIVRPLEVPSAEEMQRYWNNGVERE